MKISFLRLFFTENYTCLDTLYVRNVVSSHKISDLSRSLMFLSWWIFSFLGIWVKIERSGLAAMADKKLAERHGWEPVRHISITLRSYLWINWSPVLNANPMIPSKVNKSHCQKVTQNCIPAWLSRMMVWLLVSTSSGSSTRPPLAPSILLF